MPSVEQTQMGAVTSVAVSKQRHKSLSPSIVHGTPAGWDACGWPLASMGGGGESLLPTLAILLLKVAKVWVHRKKSEDMKRERVAPHQYTRHVSTCL